MIIRRASYADLHSLLHLAETSFRETYESHNDPEVFSIYIKENFNEEIMGHELADSRASFFIALTEGRPVGYAKLGTGRQQPNWPSHSQIEIERLYFLQSSQGRGLGTRLMTYCMELAREQGYSIIWLGVWEQNLKAISFYIRQGYRQFGKHIFWMGPEAQEDILMFKTL